MREDMLLPGSSLSSGEAVQTCAQALPLAEGEPSSRDRRRRKQERGCIQYGTNKDLTGREGKPPSGMGARRIEMQCPAQLCGRTPEYGQTMKFSDKSHCSNVFLSWR